jgi:hypothetical protein
MVLKTIEAAELGGHNIGTEKGPSSGGPAKIYSK